MQPVSVKKFRDVCEVNQSIGIAKTIKGRLTGAFTDFCENMCEIIDVQSAT